MKKFKEILTKLERLLYGIGFITVILWLIDERMDIYLNIVMILLICLQAYLGKQFFFGKKSSSLKNLGLFLDGSVIFIFSKSITVYYFPEVQYWIPITVPCIMLCIWFILHKNNIADV